MLEDAIQHYHDLLASDLAAESQARLERLQRVRSLMFGPQPVAAALRPRFLTHTQYHVLCSAARALLPALNRIYRIALADETFRRQFGLSETEEALFRIDPGFDECCPAVSLDAVLGPDQVPRFTCLHAEPPGGATFQDVLGEVFLGLPVMGEFLRSYDMRPLPARPGVLHALLGTYRRWQDQRQPPHIAILDWRTTPAYGELFLLEEYFRAQGYECVIAEPRELEYREGRLYTGEIPLDLLYRRVRTGDMLSHGGLDQPVIQAVRERAVCMVNPFRCTLLDRRISFAILSDERNEHLFSAEERAVIRNHVPWTRRVEERRTQYAGREVDLMPFLLANRERLILKPNNAQEGGRTVPGWTVDATAWEQAVQQAANSLHVVQERIDALREPYPSYTGGRMEVAEQMVETALQVCHCEYVDSCLTRLPTAGAGRMVPTFLVERR